MPRQRIQDLEQLLWWVRSPDLPDERSAKTEVIATPLRKIGAPAIVHEIEMQPAHGVHVTVGKPVKQRLANGEKVRVARSQFHRSIPRSALHAVQPAPALAGHGAGINPEPGFIHTPSSRVGHEGLESPPERLGQACGIFLKPLHPALKMSRANLIVKDHAPWRARMDDRCLVKA